MYFLNGFANGFITGLTFFMVTAFFELDDIASEKQLSQQTGWCFGAIVGTITLISAFVFLWSM